MYIIKISGDSYKIILSADDLKEYPEKLFDDADSSKQFFSDIMRTLDGNELKNDTRSIAHAEFFENKSGGGELFLCLYRKSRERIYYKLDCDNLENIITVSKSIKRYGFGISASLFQMNSQYQLIFFLDKENDLLMRVLKEFGSTEKITKYRIWQLEEHGKILIRRNAIEKICDFFT